jgi:ABC-type dipeptide/oligopeptide/nickel transport system ATPase subunit
MSEVERAEKWPHWNPSAPCPDCGQPYGTAQILLVDPHEPELRRFWSSNNERSWQLRNEFEQTYGRPMTDVEAQRAMYVSRRKKSAADKERDVRPVWERWAEDARTNGYELNTFRAGSPVERDPYVAMGVLHQRLMSANGLCRENAVFTGSEIRPAVARCAVGLGFSPRELDGYAAILTASDNLQGLIPVRRANDPDHAYWTPRAVLAAESRIEKAASSKARDVLSHPSELTIARSIKAADVKLDREQIRGVELVCSGSGWVNITGRAGTGKTSLLKVAVAAYRHETKTVDVHDSLTHPAAAEIVVVSMVAKTAADTGRKIGADRWGSVESIIRQADPPAKRSKTRQFIPTKDTLVIVEEAGQMDTLRMAKLLKAVGPARIVTVGDDAQLTPIGAGGWYQDQLSQIGGIELVNVRRHKDPLDIRDYQLMRQGRAPEALRNMDQRGRVHISEDRAHRVADVLMDYQDHREGWRAQDIRIIADTSNEDIDTCNRFVQRDRVARNEVGAEGFDVHDTEQDRRWTLHENDQVIFLRSHFIKGQAPVKNGTEGLLLSVDNRSGRARVRIPDGDGQRIVVVRLNAHEQNQPIGLAYAVHANKYQGAEVPIVLSMPGMGQTNANSAYSMVTRSTHETHVYASRDLHGPDPIAALGKAWSEREIKQSALSKLNEIRRESLTALRNERESSNRQAPELYDIPELEEVPEMDPVRLDRLENALAGADRQRTALRDEPAPEKDFDRPSFERDFGERDLGRDHDRPGWGREL